MEHFASMRKLDSDTRSFTAELADDVAFVEMPNVSGPVVDSFMLDQRVWAKRVFDSATSDEVLIVVHGYNVLQNSFMHEVSKIRQMVQVRGFKGAVIGFDWPSAGGILAYYDDRDAVVGSASFLTRHVIPALRAHSGSADIHILAHSMGTRLVVDALQYAKKNGLGTATKRAVDQIIFTAPELPQSRTAPDGDVLTTLRSFSNRFTSYWSGADEVLHIAEDKFGEETKRFGRYGPLGTDAGRLEDIDCSTYFDVHESRRYLRPDNHVRHTHNWFYKQKRFYHDVAWTLNASKKSNPRRSALGNGRFKFI